MPADEPHRPLTDDEPDPRLLWRWVKAAVRPHVGWILIGLGALVMLFGYLGVSREALPAKQLPYLVSGGIGGVFLAVLGAYFLGTQEMRNDSGRLDRLERMVAELHLALLRPPGAAEPASATADATTQNGSHGVWAPSPATTANGSSGALRRVLVVDGGETFHRAGCALAVDKDTEDLTPAAARKRGLRPCPACTPVPAGAAS